MDSQERQNRDSFEYNHPITGAVMIGEKWDKDRGYKAHEVVKEFLLPDYCEYYVSLHGSQNIPEVIDERSFLDKLLGFNKCSVVYSRSENRGNIPLVSPESWALLREV